MTKKKLLILTILMVVLLQIILPLKSLAALVTGEKFSVEVVKVVKNSAVQRERIVSRCLQSTGHSGYYHSTNLRSLAQSAGFLGYVGYKWSQYTTVPSTYTSGLAPNNNYASVHYNITGNAPYKADETLFLFFSTTFYLNYNANGGSGAPASQTATSVTESSHDFTISSTNPTRPEYTFLGWSTSSTATSPSYYGGGNINVTGTTTLYAVWKKIYALDYKTNDYNVENMPEGERDNTLEPSTTFNVSTKKPTRPGYDFLGWTEEDNSSKVKYTENQEIVLTAANPTKTLYPVWKEKPEVYEPANLWGDYNIEYYYDNVKDNSKTESNIYETIGTEITESKLSRKLTANRKTNYSNPAVLNVPYVVEDKANEEEKTIKVFYESEKQTNPSDDKTYTITVRNNKDGHTYDAFQIFSGDFYADESGNAVLSNIEWGENLDTLIVDSDKTHGDAILERLKNPEYSKYADEYKDCNTAAEIADKLSQNESQKYDGPRVRDFVNIVADYIVEKGIEKTESTNQFIESADSITGAETTYYQITGLQAGYYVVIDANIDAEHKDDNMYSRYLLDVVQDVTMYVKTSVPTLTKSVTGNNIKKEIRTVVSDIENEEEQSNVEKTYILDNIRNTATYKEDGEDYDIGFQLNTSIPNTDTYKQFTYIITDILSKGFDFDQNSLVVTIGGSKYTDYTLTNELDEETGNRKIVLNFGNIVDKIGKGIEKGQDVIINYNAKLNEKAEAGNVANTNQAYLTYSNNPYTDETTQTSTVYTYTYAIGLDISKIAEIKDDSTSENEVTEENLVTTELEYLSGAEFTIYKAIEDENGELTGEKVEIAKITSNEVKNEEGNVIKELGHAIYSGLGAGTYYIKETKSPDGYNRLKNEIELKIDVSCTELGEPRWDIKYQKDTELVNLKEGFVENEKGDTKIQCINLEVQNTSGFQLPATGGRGTIIFTVIGLSIMIIVGISLKVNKNKQN